MISKESSLKIEEFPPKEPPKVSVTQKQMKETARNAMKDVHEIDLLALKKKYRIDGPALSKIVVNK